MATCYSRTRGYYYCSNRWSDWGRWVLLGVVVLAVIFFFFACSCITARRRRKAGQKPFYGTGWAAPGAGAPTYQPQYGQQQNYNQGYNNNTTQPGYTGANSGYYGAEANMQAPQNTYRGDESGFQPPAGPPPGKVA